MFTTNRANHPRSRRNLFAAAAVTLTFSLAVAISPAVGANQSGGASGNSGTLKVHDAATGQEAAEHSNEPFVCDFWLEFSYPGTDELGTWQVLSWPPTGDGSVVASGTYDTSGDGVDASATINLPAGHYRVEWRANGSHNSKNKTIWVDRACDETDPAPVEDPAPVGDPAPVEDPAPVVDPAPVEDPAPVIDNGSNPDSGQLGEVTPAGTGASIPDTAMPAPSGLTATLALLLVIIGHAAWRRRKGLVRE